MLVRVLLLSAISILGAGAGLAEPLTLTTKTATCFVENGKDYVFEDRSVVVFSPAVCPEDQSATAGVAALAQNSDTASGAKRYFVTVPSFSCFLQNIKHALSKADGAETVSVELGCQE